MQMQRAFRNLSALCLASFIASACAVTDYKKPVGDMAAAVEQSITTIEKLDDDIAKVVNARWMDDLQAGEAQVFTVDDQCALNSPGCALEIRFHDSDKVKAFPATSVIPKARAGLAGLKAYVANLKAIIDADTADKVTASANSALGSLITIEKALADPGEPPGGPISDFGNPTVSAISWFVGQYVAYTKVNALRRSTKDAEPVIGKLAVFYDTIAEAAKDYFLGEAATKFVQAQETFDEISGNPTAAQIDAYVKVAADYDRVLRATAARPLKAFAEVHTKLSRQLSGEEVTLSQVTAAIEDLGQRAKAFKEVVDQFAAAADG